MARKYTLTEMKKANNAAGHYFFKKGNRAFFGPHHAVYNRANETNYVVVVQKENQGQGSWFRFVWYKFDARTGIFNPITKSSVPSTFRTNTEIQLERKEKVFR